MEGEVWGTIVHIKMSEGGMPKERESAFEAIPHGKCTTIESMFFFGFNAVSQFARHVCLSEQVDLPGSFEDCSCPNDCISSHLRSARKLVTVRESTACTLGKRFRGLKGAQDQDEAQISQYELAMSSNHLQFPAIWRSQSDHSQTQR